jgi:iron complex transport system substrate-binding protein
MRALLGLILVATLLAGCTAPGVGSAVVADTPAPPTAVVAASPTAQASPTAAAVFPLRLTDSGGRSVELKAVPRRIVSVSPAFTEVLFAIGAGGQVVGTDDFTDYPEAAKALPRVGYSKLDLEKIVGLNPDLVLLATRQRLFVADVEKLGLPVLLYAEPDTVAGVFEHIRLLGRVTDHAGQADELARAQEARLQQLTGKLTAVTKGPRVFHELTPDLFTVGPKSFIGDMYQILKAENIVRDPSNPFPKISFEALVAADPEYVFLADGSGTGTGGESPATVKARPGWSGVSAVKNDRVYVIDGNVLSRPGPRVVDGIEQLARILYPDKVK